jgi:hypothetical protein
VDQDRLALAGISPLEDVDPNREERLRHRGRLNHRQRFGHRQALTRGRDRILRIAAARQQSADRLTQLQGHHALAE